MAIAVSAIETVLKQCSGVNVVRERNTNSYSSQQWDETFNKIGEIKLPEEPIFIEITATATKGTIAKVVDIEGIETKAERYSSLDKYKDSIEIVTWDTTFIYEVDGRKQKGRIKDQYTKVLTGEQETKYVRDVQKHEKVVVKNPVNKFKQEMQKGDWVIGVKRGHSLGIGRITRWTNHNVWAITGDDLNDKSKEFQFASISEVFTMPDDEHVPMLTMAVLKGWNGR